MKRFFSYVALCFSDSSVRFNLGMLFGMILNILYIAFNFVLGILYGNVWLITVGAYYMLIVVLRYMLIDDTSPDNSRVPRLVSRLLLIVAIPMTGIIVYTVLTDYRGLLPRRIVPVLVLYAALSLIRALFGIFFSKHREKGEKSLHLIRLSLALVSIFNFQVAYLNYLWVDYSLKSLINLITGAAVTTSLLALSSHLRKI